MSIAVLIKAMKRTLDEPDAGPEYVSLHPRPGVTIEAATRLSISRNGDWIVPPTKYCFHMGLPSRH